MKMADLITGLFDTEEAAENAVAQLKQLGYSQNEISIIMRDRGAAADMAHEAGVRTMEGVGTGATIGGVIGAALAAIFAIGSVAIPGVGLIAAGPLAAMFAGAGAGGLAGSLLGWLVGAGIPEDVAPYYERGLSAGGVVVAVAAHPGDDARVQEVLHGGAVAYAGANTPTYVSPNYASRYHDVTPRATTGNEAVRTVTSDAAEQRADMRTAAEHGREAERDLNRTNPVSGTAAAVENEADRTATALKNQADKVSTGARNETDRINNP
jgi:uncharacterized membrane protein